MNIKLIFTQCWKDHWVMEHPKQNIDGLKDHTIRLFPTIKGS